MQCGWQIEDTLLPYEPDAHLRRGPGWNRSQVSHVLQIKQKKFKHWMIGMLIWRRIINVTKYILSFPTTQ